MTLCPQLRRLSAEHARCLADIAGWASTGAEERCSRLLSLWDQEVLPHCQAEEDVLLPELAARLSEADAVVLFTLGDHLALRHLARQLREASGTERIAALEAMERRLTEHVRFEERTLFPAIQEVLGSDRIAGLASDLAVPSRKRGQRSLRQASYAPEEERPLPGKG